MTQGLPRLAAVQMTSGPEVSANLAVAAELIGIAAGQGAKLVVLPENFAFFGARERDKLAVAETEGVGPIQTFLADQAGHHGIWLVGGTLPMAARDGRIRAASLLFGPDGQQTARYDKIHLFDVALDGGEQYRESRHIEPGDEVVVADTALGLGLVGMAVCYDLRFPELFRQMVARGARIMVLPSAFTAASGAAHWHLLLRARAVENLCYVVAPDQVGRHANGRDTYGHSLIVDPWGAVLAECSGGPGIVTADFDSDQLAARRRRFPALTHRRLP
ncbi:MAG: carbon-nitrogen hydrolase family protein [Gammaproteobacteria bacterium]|nr:carbon-nitrogen hydrolase family protein [Gammaproteobacteria bacterium]